MEKYHKQDVAPIEKENERDEIYEASNPQIDSERTRSNYRFTPYFGKTYTEFINGRIKELGLSLAQRRGCNELVCVRLG